MRYLLIAILSLLGTAHHVHAQERAGGDTSLVRFSSQLKLITPDQDYAIRRPVTESDRARIALYRSGNIKPSFETDFSSNSDLSAWEVHIDDNEALRSCRSPQSIRISSEGLALEILNVTGCGAKWSTGQLVSRNKFGFGYFESSMKIAAIPGVDNAFWMNTSDHYEIDIVEAFHPNSIISTVHQWAPAKGEQKTMVSSRIQVMDNLAEGFHDYGLLWTPTEMIFAVDGIPYLALLTKGAAQGKALLRLSNALVPWGNKIPPEPQGNYTTFRGVRVFPLVDN
ncbi:glycoside hydrolase family 16 protein [Agrobacterium tumefaciens]|uniref:glycoside hydrolase family 16 protein n=1 Tax=Agrobacterium tumefaciens TaxID=358 RepID=UPI00384B2F30